MQNFFNLIKHLKIPTRTEIKSAIFSFNKKEWNIFLAFILVLFISTIAILQNINQHFMVPVATAGGSITEGIVGSPRFINPSLALTEADKDMVALIYSGLMRKMQNGEIVPDLAKDYTISKDGLVYTFTLKDEIYFHDNKPITTEDIIFTIEQIKDPILKSPYKGSWDGVSVKKINDKTIEFTLKQPFVAFLENTTLGILPKHIWENTTIELSDANINAIGSGPFMINNVNKISNGNVSSITLKSFKKFALGKPYLKNITLKFYDNESDALSALEGGSIDQIASVSAENAIGIAESLNTHTSVLPRIFGIFFNQNQNQIFTNKNVVNAINKAINKDKIVSSVLYGYGVAIDNPIPQNLIPYQTLDKEDNTSPEENQKIAQEILAKDGWKLGGDGILEKTITDKNKKKTTQKLEFTISTGNAPELAKSAELIKADLEKVGIKVNILTFEIGNLNQTVIRPRNYDALLFGQIITHESDLFAFWHSSQRKDPGLNVAVYTNAKVDKILEETAITIDENQRAKKYAEFENEIKKDLPAVFLYSPKFIYIAKNNLQGVNIENISSPEDRFNSAYLWYTQVDNIWKIFTK